MCLDTVDKEIKKTKESGWKVFKKGPRGLISLFFEGRVFPIKKWITDRRKGNVDSDEYQKGFHIYATKHAAKRFCFRGCVMRKVEFKDVVATGTQIGLKVIVARKMKILEEK